MMLNYLSDNRHDPHFAECTRPQSRRLRRGIAGETTKDLGGTLGTAEFADALIALADEIVRRQI